MRRYRFLLLVATFLLGIPAAASGFGDDVCADCHTNTGGEPTEIGPDLLIGSVHEGFSCLDCHTGITSIPHAPTLPDPDCGSCHEDVRDTYVQHGRGFVGVSEAVPSCQDCHGSHRILSHTDSRSLVHSSNLPASCGNCHEDQELLARLNIKFKHPIEVYQKGVHGKATAGGKDTAASCNDCHSTGGTAHRILPPGEVESTINYFNISVTCGKCHSLIQQEFEAGIHGELVARGEVDAPTCTHCHGEHGILATADPRSPVSPFRVAEATCTPCHDSAKLNEKYELPTGRLQSYVDSYHGLKSRAGDKTVANCASCHGAHLILPSDNPASSVAPQNLEATCGHCHTGISSEKAIKSNIHAPSTGQASGWPYFIRIIYQVLIVLVIGGMTTYCILDWLRQVRNMMKKPQVRRMETDEVMQHAVLAVSFTVLVVTGFSLRFYDAWWAKFIFAHEGGAQVRGLIHRGAAVVMMLGSLWHVGFLMTTKGRIFLADIAPKREDVKLFWQALMYNLGRSDHHPHMRRFSFVEKAEYWALIWGTVVMALTGLCLWFEAALVAQVGKGTLEVFLVIHYYEAWLAFLAILVWHMYGVMFNPRVYPMNPSWATGTMPREMFEAEHGAAQSSGNVDKRKRLGRDREI
ncbi:MAG: cytochrome b/b6 domain-containing protein [Candidatus Krumholzibacteriia bacterium]